MSVFLTLDRRKMKGKKRSVLCVRVGEKRKFYPLNKTGCRKAGADMYQAGVEDWMHSSSLNWPEEYGFRHDPHELIREGWKAEYDKAEAPRKSLVAKMLAHAETPEFQATLTPEERAALVKLKKRVEENDG